MPNLHIRGVPPEVHARLKAQAAAEGRSFNDHLVRVLADGAQRLTGQEWIDRLAGIARTDPPLTREEIVAGIHGDRREREEQLARRAR
jgi:antitoxin FitA